MAKNKSRKSEDGNEREPAPKRRSGSGQGNMKTSTKVVIIVLAVIMAFAMMLPSFASVIASDRQDQEQAEQQNAANQNDSADSSSDNGSSDDNSSSDNANAAATDGVPEKLQSLATQYAPKVSTLESKLESEPNNLAALLNVAQDYMSWGYQAVSQSSSDEETSYANGLLDKAIGYYDRYLALNDSNSAKVDRALCQYYEGDTTDALAALEQITTDSPDFAPAWANLGMLYERSGDTDKAKDAYQKASDADPNNEYGAKSFADQRLVQITTSQNSNSSNATSVVSNSGNSTEQGLTDALADKSGTAF